MPDDRENYNRIFIVAGRGCSEDDVRESFDKYGTIKDIHIVKDRNSGEPKGVTQSKPTQSDGHCD